MKPLNLSIPIQFSLFQLSDFKLACLSKLSCPEKEK